MTRSSRHKNSVFIHFHVWLIESLLVILSPLSIQPTWWLKSATVSGFIAFPCSQWKLPSCGGSCSLVSMQISLSCPSTALLSCHPWSSLKCPLISVSLSCISNPLAWLSNLVQQFHKSLCFSLSCHHMGGGGDCPCTICDHILPSSLSILSLWHEMLSSVVLCTVCHSPGKLSCHVCNQFRCKIFVNFNAKMPVFLRNVLSENYSPFEQHSHFINGQIFWRAVKFWKMSCLEIQIHLEYFHRTFCLVNSIPVVH